MPRSAADRTFGFRSKGLVRILLASDIEEVRKALLELNLEPADKPASLVDLLGELFDNIFGPILLAREITIAFLDKFFPITPPGQVEAEGIPDDVQRLLVNITVQLEEIEQRLTRLRRDHQLHPTSADDKRLAGHLNPIDQNLDQIGSNVGLASRLLNQITPAQETANEAKGLRERLQDLEVEREQRALDFRERLEENVPEVPTTATI